MRRRAAGIIMEPRWRHPPPKKNRGVRFPRERAAHAHVVDDVARHVGVLAVDALSDVDPDAQPGAGRPAPRRVERDGEAVRRPREEPGADLARSSVTLSC